MMRIGRISGWKGCGESANQRRMARHYLNLYYSVFYIADLFPDLLKNIYLDSLKFCVPYSSAPDGVFFHHVVSLLRNLCSPGMRLLWPVSSCPRGSQPAYLVTCTEKGLKTRECCWQFWRV